MPATNQGDLTEVRLNMCWAFVDGYPVGWTQGGISISGSSETSDIEVDQETDPIVSVVTSTTTEITVPLAQWNLRNIQLAFPGADVRGTAPNQYVAVGSATSTGSHTLRLHPKDREDDDFSQDIFFPSVTVSSDLDISITKEDLQLLNLTFSAGPGKPPVAEQSGDKMYIGHMPASARVAVTGVTVEPAALTLSVGQESTLAAEISPGNATVKTVTWTSSDDAVAVVDSKLGVVAALSSGTATITAATKEGGFTGACAVTVI